MKFYEPEIASHLLFPEINALYLADETEVVAALLKEATLPAAARDRIAARARSLVVEVRKQRVAGSGIDAFMHQYELSSQEGVVLMCLAEALLRIPDDETIDNLIEDKIGSANWERHLGKSESLFVNASTWGLMLTGRMIKLKDSKGTFKRLIQRSGEPVIRQAVYQAMRILGRQFVMGRTIKEALERARSAEAKGYFYSYDMLGEAARTAADAERYMEAYRKAIDTIGKAAAGRGHIDSPGISVKLSALHPRYELAQGERVMKELVPRLRDLAVQAKGYDIGFTVDSEEADRLDLSLEIFSKVFADSALRGWEGFGLALQSYQKRAFETIDWLTELSQRHGRKLMVRLVKGAYWDTEIKRAQERGLEGYPLFTRKASTDVAYLACARKLLALRKEAFYPQFATHNAHSVAAVLEMAGDNKGFEFQRLHGMGDALYDQIVGKDKLGVACRIYAPVGSHEDLLPYLVRRLLENGANSSFVNRIVDEKAPIEEIIADPVTKVAKLTRIPHPHIPLPPDLFGGDRKNSKGIDLSNIEWLRWLSASMEEVDKRDWRAYPLVGGVIMAGEEKPVFSPSDRTRQVGTLVKASAEHVAQALKRAGRAAKGWDATPARERAACLERMANMMEEEMPALMAICTREAGKNISDGVAEVREAVDFCRYYAARAREYFDAPQLLPGPTGELDQIELHGRGVFACISPWNFPLAIFTGQITAALAAGNAVIAKPAEQTPLVAFHAVQMLHRAGVPGDVLQFLPGDGATVGAGIVNDPRVSGVAFTGSTETAWVINRALAGRRGPIAPLIAETGGQNVMIVDSSALLEQVVADILFSSFQSAGQRCSALRVLFIQQDVADKLDKMLAGAMAELNIGDPWSLATDVGPVIDEQARAMLQAHAERMEKEGRLIYRCRLPESTSRGSFFPPQAFEIDRMERLEREVFGPILHVVRYRASELDKVIDSINNAGYGLTFGIHSRIDNTIRYVLERIGVGNAYVNRNMIGAVVGVQPFGGEGLSGTGPKAGGPHYLYRFATERTLSVNTTAAGGNASLMSLQEEDV
jgi:RHH-type proline utilization regulon transcriptional repressor/proline dehydrogenase/delta 1-pyrroline-5-carboxylate dehydrogenase